jgi:hypothetical protein
LTEFKLGKAGGLDLSAAPSAVVCAALMAVGLSAAGVFLLRLPVLEAVIGGLAATYLHYDSELFHQMGHARAARKVGYPMTGLRYWAIFSASVYPPDEPELPAEVHIRRALGGPLYSAIMTAFAGVPLYLMNVLGLASGVVWYVFLFFALDNLLFFTLGSFLPLGFTDGSTLLYWWPKRNKK